MKLRVLVVDDSVVFRSQIKAALEISPAIEVVGAANNGKIALQKLAQGSVDVVTLDMEMPEMGGLETLKQIRLSKFPVRVVVFSSHTTRGSEMALEALSAGADDFVAKPSSSNQSFQNAAERISGELVPKILQFSPGILKAQSTTPDSARARSFARRDLDTFLPSVIVIGSSTGGPPALEKVLHKLNSPMRVPILIAQHMPPVFTASLSRRLTDISGVKAEEGKHGEVVVPNRIYVAPGDFHMTLKKSLNGDVLIQLDQGPLRNSVRPAVDNLFESAVSVYAAKVLGVVLTGMGEDGRVGCRQIKEAGGGVMIQDKESCVVFGMPGAIHMDATYDRMAGLPEIRSAVNRMVT